MGILNQRILECCTLIQERMIKWGFLSCALADCISHPVNLPKKEEVTESSLCSCSHALHVWDQPGHAKNSSLISETESRIWLIWGIPVDSPLQFQLVMFRDCCTRPMDRRVVSIDAPTVLGTCGIDNMDVSPQMSSTQSFSRACVMAL